MLTDGCVARITHYTHSAKQTSMRRTLDAQNNGSSVKKKKKKKKKKKSAQKPKRRKEKLLKSSGSNYRKI